MTRGELLEFIAKHGNKCAICNKPGDTEYAHGLSVDHDHKCCGGQTPGVAFAERPRRLCGKCARGLLCPGCNAALGHLRDDPALFARAVEYLTKEK
jgi:hypothetical protein